MAVRVIHNKSQSLHAVRAPIQKPRVQGARPKTISEAYAWSVRADRPPQSKAGQG